MNELVELLKTKAGLTDEQAQKTVEVMKEYIQGKVPPMFSGFVDSFFAGGKSDSDFMH
jgi:hypothetical protein